MCTHCQTTDHTVQAQPEPEPLSPAQLEAQEDAALCRSASWARSRPYVHSVGDWRADSIDAHSALRREWGGRMWVHFDTARALSVSSVDVRTAWARAWERKEGARVPEPASYPVPDYGASLWTGRYWKGSDWTGSLVITGGEPGEALPYEVRDGQRVPRAVLGAVRRWAKGRADCAQIVEVWERFFEGLGHVWGSPAERWGVSLSCAPASFLRLGHYNEGGSCFRSGGQFEHAPLALGVMPRAYVAVFYRGDFDTPAYGPRQAEPVGRCWGQWGNTEHPGALFSNVYGVPKGTLRPLLREVLGHMFGYAADDMDSADTYNEACGVSEEAVYLNGDAEAMGIDPRSLSRWAGSQSGHLWEAYSGQRASCTVCGHSFDPDYEGSCCEGCYEAVCDDCATYFDGEGTYCSDCRTPAHCADCGNVFDADDASECAGCYDSLCPDCARSCGDCGDTLCEGCAEECSACGDTLCEGCGARCDDCAEHFCVSCAPHCEGCDATVCEDCADDHREGCEQASLELESQGAA